MNKLNLLSAGIAAAITLSLAYSLCALAFALVPNIALDFVNTLFHGLDLSTLKPVGRKALVISTFFYGLCTVAILSFVFGVLFAFFYNLFLFESSSDERSMRQDQYEFS